MPNLRFRFVNFVTRLLGWKVQVALGVLMALPSLLGQLDYYAHLQMALRLDLWYVLWHGFQFGPWHWLDQAVQFAYWTLGVTNWQITFCSRDYSHYPYERSCWVKTW